MSCAATVALAQSGKAAVAKGGISLGIAVRGAGTTALITSDPAGLKCTKKGKLMMRCEGTFPAGPVTLTAIPPAGSMFMSYTGGGCNRSDSTCTVSLTSNTSMTASFGLPSVAVHVDGGGFGRVTSRPEGIYCTRSGGGSCAKEFPRGTSVTLTAVPDTKVRLTRWEGACSGDAPTCTVIAGKARIIIATFNPP